MVLNNLIMTLGVTFMLLSGQGIDIHQEVNYEVLPYLYEVQDLSVDENANDWYDEQYNTIEVLESYGLDEIAESWEVYINTMNEEYRTKTNILIHEYLTSIN